jgi:hypothetical protein
LQIHSVLSLNIWFSTGLGGSKDKISNRTDQLFIGKRRDFLPRRNISVRKSVRKSVQYFRQLGLVLRYENPWP